MKKTYLVLAITALFLSGLQAVNAQGIMNKIKKKTEEITKPTEPTQTATNAVKSNGKLNVKDVFKEAAPLLQITQSANADKVISQIFEGENRIAFKVPGNLGMSTEGTLRTNGEAKIFPTSGGGGMFAITYTACTTDNMCDNQMQLILIENNQEPQLATGTHLATFYTSTDKIIELLRANKTYKKPIQAFYKPNINFKDNKLNYVVDCADGNCQTSFVVRSFTFDGEKFVEAK